MLTTEVIKALRQAADIIECESDVIEGFHNYAHAHGCTPGRNVFEFLLEDAKRLRSQTVAPGPQEGREPCGRCDDTGEVCYSSTSYGPCPECGSRAVPATGIDLGPEDFVDDGTLTEDTREESE